MEAIFREAMAGYSDDEWQSGEGDVQLEELNVLVKLDESLVSLLEWPYGYSDGEVVYAW